MATIELAFASPASMWMFPLEGAFRSRRSVCFKACSPQSGALNRKVHQRLRVEKPFEIAMPLPFQHNQFYQRFCFRFLVTTDKFRRVLLKRYHFVQVTMDQDGWDFCFS